MENNKPTSTPVETRTFKLVSLAAAFIAICLLFIVAFNSFQPDQKSLSDLYFPSPTATFTFTPTLTSTPTSTSTPTPTSTPDYLLTAVSQGNIVFAENFETNDNAWEGFYFYDTVAVKDGQLSLATGNKGSIGIAYCALCPTTGETYFLEAEITSEQNTSARYGLAFCFDKNYSNFYVFQTNSTSNQFDLYKHTALGWKALARNKYSVAKQSFPLSNKLGVYFDHGTINLYINDTLAYSYVDDESNSCEQYGFFINSGVKLFADNLTIYDIQVTP